VAVGQAESHSALLYFPRHTTAMLTCILLYNVAACWTVSSLSLSHNQLGL